MSSLYRRINAVIPLVAAASLAGKEGYFYKLDENNQAVLCSAATDVPHGLILSVRESGLEISAAPFGGNHGTVGVKLGGAVTDLSKDLTLKADGTAESDDAAGARVIVARPLETGAADEMIECVLLSPKSIGNAVVLGNANGEIAALTFTAGGATGPEVEALRDKCEELGDDVRALYAALQTAGILA